MKNLDIKSDTINKGLEIIEDSTKETRHAIDKHVSSGINKVIELLKSTPIGIKIDTYIAERPLKFEESIRNMKKKYKKIPDEFKTEPSSYIAFKAVQELSCSLDEEHLKEIFENILVSDMDKRKKDRVLPSYIEIVKQLTSNDANFLRLLKKWGSFCAIEIQVKTDGIRGVNHLDEFIIYDYQNKDEIERGKIEKVNPLVIETLSYLNLLENKIGTYYTQREEEYTYLFNKTKGLYNLDDGKHTITYEKCTISFTNLGKNFIDICLS